MMLDFHRQCKDVSKVITTSKNTHSFVQHEWFRFRIWKFQNKLWWEMLLNLYRYGWINKCWMTSAHLCLLSAVAPYQHSNRIKQNVYVITTLRTPTPNCKQHLGVPNLHFVLANSSHSTANKTSTNPQHNFTDFSIISLSQLVMRTTWTARFGKALAAETFAERQHDLSICLTEMQDKKKKKITNEFPTAEWGDAWASVAAALCPCALSLSLSLLQCGNVCLECEMASYNCDVSCLSAISQRCI